MEQSWVYIGFVNGGFEIVWCSNFFLREYGGPPPRKCRNMKCSRSDSRYILGLLRVSIFPIYYDIFFNK